MPILNNIAVAAARAYGFTSRMKKLVTVTFSNSQTWVAPLNVAVVDIVGRGGDGTAGGSSTGTVSGYNTYYVIVHFREDGTVESQEPLAYGGWTQGNPPADYCRMYGTSIEYCWYYAPATGTGTVYYPPTTGSASQALGKTFAGGAGGAAAAPMSYQNVPVIPGDAYQIIVGAATGGASTNGSITISYWQ